MEKKKSNNIVSIIFGVILVVFALLSIQVYMKRGVRARIKQPVDDIGDQYFVGEQQLEQLNRLKNDNKLDEETYNKAKENIESRQ